MDFFKNEYEVEDSLRKDFPPILYKYRDWSNEFHRNILTENKVWFAHPKELNDPQDIRVPYRFDYEEVNHPIFFEKFKDYAVKYNWFPFLLPDSIEFVAACENKLELIKNDPKKYFDEMCTHLRNGNIYDRVGVLSLAKNPLNQPMWTHYSCNASGFCVGFDAFEIYNSINSIGFGPVDYDNKPVQHSFIHDTIEDTILLHFRKSANHSFEEEMRFITLDINQTEDRLKPIPRKTIREVLVGMNISAIHLNEIITVLKTEYESTVKLYNVKTDNLSFSLKKVEITY